MYTRKASKDKVLSTEDFQFEAIPFHAKTIESTLEILQTDLSGLSLEDVHVRQAKLGSNSIGTKESKIGGLFFLTQCKSLVFYLLLIAAVLTLVLGQPERSLAIMAALFIISGLNLVAQWLGHKSLATIGNIEATSCSVLRNGRQQEIPSETLVPGDVLTFGSGTIIPADARLISSDELQMDESMVTGESTLVKKDAQALLIPDQDLTEQTNMVFAGSRVKTGKGVAVVTTIGSQTLMGNIAQLADATEKRQSKLTSGINRLTGVLFVAAMIIAIGIGSLQYAQGQSWVQILQFSTVLLVAAMPEILAPLATFLLAIGINALSKKNILVKNLHAMESVGNMTVLCTDKTGTLTENALIMHKIFLPELGEIDYNAMWREAKSVPNAAIEEFLRIARMNNTTVMDGIRSAFMGDPIDIALYRASSSVFERGYHCVKEIPFDPATLRTATIVRSSEGNLYSYIKGAPESVLAACQNYLKCDGSVAPLHPYERDEYLLRNQELALELALRVIGFGKKELLDEHDDPYEGATFVAWACLIDPPKQGAMEGVRLCKESGLRMVMITGDQKATAAVTARKLGLLQEGDEIWTRKDLDGGVESIPASVAVFARTKPEEKLAIVESLQRSGEVVGMVGDGVNDTPALQRSDIAIAMGLNGTDAAQESAGIILLNDRFDGIVEAIRESRHITRNIDLCVQYIVSCNVSLLFLAAFLSILSLLGLVHFKEFPINPVQMLWLNVVMMSIPTISLAFLPDNASDSAHYSPHSHSKTFLASEAWSFVVFWGILMMAAGATTYMVAQLAFHLKPEVCNTLTFFAMAAAQLLNLLNIHLRYSGMKLGRFAQKIFQVPIVSLILVFSALTQAAVYWVEPLHGLFGIVAVPLYAWGIPLGCSILAVAASLMFSQSEPTG